MENGPEMKIYFLLKMVIFQPAMLVYQRVPNWNWLLETHPFWKGSKLNGEKYVWNLLSDASREMIQL